MIKTIKAVYDFKVVMKDNVLYQADTKVFINNKLHATSRLRLVGERYHFLKNKKKG